MKRVLIAGLYHETHTFLQGLTRCEDCEIKRGRTLIDSPGGGSPLAGAVEAAERLGWDLIPAIDLRAMPGPTVADEAVQRFWDALQRPLLENIERNLDGVFLVLHGAMVSESCDDVEGEILHRLRNALGNRRIPVCGVVDLHANFTRRMAENADALIAYHENPHADAKASAERAAQLLDRLMEAGRRPMTLWQHPPILWPPTGTATNADPMRSLEAQAREIERRHDDILAVNVLDRHAGAMLEQPPRLPLPKGPPSHLSAGLNGEFAHSFPPGSILSACDRRNFQYFNAPSCIARSHVRWSAVLEPCITSNRSASTVLLLP
jgi:microcystin degradation protein MlrC